MPRTPYSQGHCANCGAHRLLKYAHRTMCAPLQVLKAASALRQARLAGGGADDAVVPTFCYKIEAVLGMRFCDPDQLIGKKRRNRLAAADKAMCYLTRGTFKEDSNDAGFIDTRWVELEELYEKYGHFGFRQGYFVADSPDKTCAVFQRIRSEGYPADIGGLPVVSVRDLGTGLDTSKPDGRTDMHWKEGDPMITFTLGGADGCGTLTIRASGTEPKLKYYLEVQRTSGDAAEAVGQQLRGGEAARGERSRVEAVARLAAGEAAPALLREPLDRVAGGELVTRLRYRRPAGGAASLFALLVAFGGAGIMALGEAEVGETSRLWVGLLCLCLLYTSPSPRD